MTVRNITRALAVLRTLLRRELVDFRRDSRRMTFVFGAAHSICQTLSKACRSSSTMKTIPA